MRDPINEELHRSRHDHTRKEPHGQHVAHAARLMDAENSRKRSRRHHIIPQFYLQHFARGGKVCVTDFQSDLAPYRTGAVNALCIKDFYTVSTQTRREDDTIEQFLSKIESAVKPVVERLLNDMTIPEGKDKENLAVFLATLFLRGPHARQVQLELYEGMVKLFSDQYFASGNVFEEEWERFRTMCPKVKLTREEFRHLLDEIVVEGYMTRESYVELFVRTLPRQAALFNHMTPSVWLANPSSRARFITGDFPFVFEDKSDRSFGIPLNGGLLNKNVRICIPLSPLTCLILEHGGESTVWPICGRTLIPITNSQVALSATRYVVSQSNELYWYKNREIYRSAEALHREFYPAKLNQPAIQMSVAESGKVTARGNWNKLKGDTPPDGMRAGRTQRQTQTKRQRDKRGQAPDSDVETGAEGLAHDDRRRGTADER
jgi:uncharacterized protein DUF4238